MSEYSKEKQNIDLQQEYTIKIAKRILLQNDFILFCQCVFELLEGSKMLMNWHHHYFAKICQKIYDRELTHVIINCPPGASKTFIFSVLFPLWCFAKDPHCKFLCTSFSDARLKQSSVMIKDVMKNPKFQELFPDITFKADTDSKDNWMLMKDNVGVGAYFAATLSGRITGGRAGYLPNESEDFHKFDGAIIVDDPQKPEDVFSDAKREGTNRKFESTLMSRRAKAGTTPVIVIMQRLHRNDPSGFLLDGGVGEEWDHFVIPAVVNEEYVNGLPDFIRPLARKELLPKIRMSEESRCSYWEDKEPLESLLKIEAKSDFFFQSQYMQQPVSLGGGIFKPEWWVQEEYLPNNFDYIRITADTAQKTGEQHDFTVFLCYGVKDNHIYLLALKRAKWTAPDLIVQAKRFYQDAKNVFGDKLQSFYIEDKVSGVGLIQTLQKETRIPIVPLKRTKDKFTRAMTAQPYVEGKRVHIPANCSWKGTFLMEMSCFTENLDAEHDDIVDCVVSAIEIEFVKTNKAQVKILNIY